MAVDIQQIKDTKWEFYNRKLHKDPLLNNYISLNPIRQVFDLEDSTMHYFEPAPQMVHMVRKECNKRGKFKGYYTSVEVDLGKAWHKKFKKMFLNSEYQNSENSLEEGEEEYKGEKIEQKTQLGNNFEDYLRASSHLENSQDDNYYVHERKTGRFQFSGTKKFKELQPQFYKYIDQMFNELCKEDACLDSCFPFRRITFNDTLKKNEPKTMTIQTVFGKNQLIREKLNPTLDSLTHIGGKFSIQQLLDSNEIEFQRFQLLSYKLISPNTAQFYSEMQQRSVYYPDFLLREGFQPWVISPILQQRSRQNALCMFQTNQAVLYEYNTSDERVQIISPLKTGPPFYYRKIRQAT